MANNCWPSRAQKKGAARRALDVQVHGVRKRPVKRSKTPLPHRHRHKVRNSMNRASRTSTTLQMYCNCESSMVWAINLHSFLHCLDHRHLSLTTAGMSTTCLAGHVASVESRLSSARPAPGTGESRQILTTCTCGTCTGMSTTLPVN